jgi:cbb3-type cytochrome oxidase subunit 1
LPKLTRWFLKASLVFLVLAVAVGALVAAPAQLALPALAGAFRPVFFHLFMVGWVAQLIFGVVFWMFPKYSKEKPRGSERLGWSVFWLLNLGLILRLVAEPALVMTLNPAWGWLLAGSAILQWAAGVLFVINTWGRVKEH